MSDVLCEIYDALYCKPTKTFRLTCYDNVQNAMMSKSIQVKLRGYLHSIAHGVEKGRGIAHKAPVH